MPAHHAPHLGDDYWGSLSIAPLHDDACQRDLVDLLHKAENTLANGPVPAESKPQADGDPSLEVVADNAKTSPEHAHALDVVDRSQRTTIT